MTTLIDVRFDESGTDATLMTIEQSGFPVPEIRDFFVGEVWQGALARIEAYLVSVAGPRP